MEAGGGGVQWRLGAAKTRAACSGGRGRRRRGRRTSTAAALAGTTALGDVGSRGGALGGDVDGGGARGRGLTQWGEQGTAAAPKETSVLGKGEGGRKEIYGGPFVPGEATTRDKRGFWAGRENSQPAAHL